VPDPVEGFRHIQKGGGAEFVCVECRCYEAGDLEKSMLGAVLLAESKSVCWQDVLCSEETADVRENQLSA
jgi:hypothetical protein